MQILIFVNKYRQYTYQYLLKKIHILIFIKEHTDNANIDKKKYGKCKHRYLLIDTDNTHIDIHKRKYRKLIFSNPVYHMSGIY